MAEPNHPIEDHMVVNINPPPLQVPPQEPQEPPLRVPLQEPPLQLNAEQKKRLILGGLAFVCFLLSGVFFYNSVFFNRTLFQSVAVMALVLLAQLGNFSMLFVVIIFGPFDFNLNRVRGGFYWKSIAELFMAGFMAYIMFRLNQPLTGDHPRRNSIDRYSIMTSFFLSLHSQCLNILLTPGFDFSNTMVFLDLSLHMAFDQERHQILAISLTLSGGFIMLLVRNLLEYIDYHNEQGAQAAAVEEQAAAEGEEQAAAAAAVAGEDGEGGAAVAGAN